MSKSIQVKSLLSHSQYSPLGTKLSPINDSFCSICTTEKRRRDSIGSCLQSVARFDWCAALLAWHRLRSGSYQITIYTLSSNAQVKSLSQQQVPWGYHARTHKQWRNVGKEEGAGNAKLWRFTYKRLLEEMKSFLPAETKKENEDGES